MKLAELVRAEIALDPETAETISENINETFHELSAMSWRDILVGIQRFLSEKLPSVGLALLVLAVGYMLVRLLMRFLKRLLESSKVADATLNGFVLSTVRIVLYVVLVITCAGILNVNLVPLITLLGAMGLAVTLAMQDILANLAGGLSILFSRPFSKGDYVEIGGAAGTIREIGMVYTVLQTLDNKKTFVPNGDVAKAVVVNYSAEPMRRLDLTFYIRDTADYAKAKRTALALIDRNPLALKTPAPFVRFTDQTPAFVRMTVYVWANTGDLFELKSELIADLRSELQDGP